MNNFHHYSKKYRVSIIADLLNYLFFTILKGNVYQIQLRSAIAGGVNNPWMESNDV